MHYVTKPELDSLTESIKQDAELEKFERRLLVYVSGKYRDRSEWRVEQNIQAAEKVAKQLWHMGFSVICPHKNTAHFGSDDIDDKAFLEGDMVMVERSDLVVMLDNWETSEGAKLERRLAQKLRIPVYYWSVHQLSLQRLAANDYRCRDARGIILVRAAAISEVTNYHPKGTHAAPGPDEIPCCQCGASRIGGPMASGQRTVNDRLRDAFLKGQENQIVAMPGSSKSSV